MLKISLILTLLISSSTFATEPKVVWLGNFMDKLWAVSHYKRPFSLKRQYCLDDPKADGLFGQNLPEEIDIRKLCVRVGLRKKLHFWIETDSPQTELRSSNYFDFFFMTQNSDGFAGFDYGNRLLDPDKFWKSDFLVEGYSYSSLRHVEELSSYTYAGEGGTDWLWEKIDQIKSKSRSSCTKERLKFTLNRQHFCKDSLPWCCFKVTAFSSESSDDFDDDRTEALQVCLPNRF